MEGHTLPLCFLHICESYEDHYQTTLDKCNKFFTFATRGSCHSIVFSYPLRPPSLFPPAGPITLSICSVPPARCKVHTRRHGNPQTAGWSCPFVLCERDLRTAKHDWPRTMYRNHHALAFCYLQNLFF
jgi:hypothetical protein